MDRKRLIIAIAITLILFEATSAQSQQSRSPATGFAVEVTFFEGKPPAYEAVRRTKLPRGEGSWFGLFGRIKEWSLPPGAQSVCAVRVVPYLDGETVKVTISVLRGEKFLDSEDIVGTYTVRENEGLAIESLRDFGVEPFKLKLIRVPPQTSDVPTILNKTKSLEVVGIELIVATFPRYKLTLHNLSEKNISAIWINTMRDGKLSLSGMAQGDEGEPLVKAGSLKELNEMLITRAVATAAGYSPASPRGQQIVIATLIFEDGSYEGEAEPAATFRGNAIGSKIELKRVVALLEDALESSTSIENVRTRLSNLSYDFDDSDVAGLAIEFPEIERNKLQTSVEASIHWLRRDVFDHLDRFQPGPSSSGDFRVYLQTMKDRYASWLLRLDAANNSR
jgi:hypothetical protein